MSDLFSFPNPVNELAARTVAAGVFVLSVATLVASAVWTTSALWATAVLAYGFVARVLTGPTLSPLGRLASEVVAPRLGVGRLVAGPPKRFAQGIGAVVTVSAVGFLAAGAPGVTQALLGLMIVAAGLEAGLGFCIGCRLFGVLMRAGVVPEETCEACANLALRA